MEAHTEGACRVIYFCASQHAQEAAPELYNRKSLPSTSHGDTTSPFAHLYDDVRTLLDVDLGAFDEVFLSARADQCRKRLEMCANIAPVAVLVEFRDTVAGDSVASAWLKDDDGSYAFLRSLSTDIQGARYQKHVTPLAVLGDNSHARRDSTVEGMSISHSCLTAGAIDVIRTPLRPEDVNRLLGHVKEVIRQPAQVIGAPMAQSLVDSIRDTSVPRPTAHRPDLLLSPERQAAVERAVGKWHFPAQDLSMDELTYAALFMLEHMLSGEDLKQYSLPRTSLVALLLAARRQYKHSKEVHYHNWRHAVDVTQSVFFFLMRCSLCPPLPSADIASQEPHVLESILTPLDALILLVSAIGHDVGHPGVNNAFLVACNHPLAQLYNDKSVLENYHCAAYSQLLRRHWPSLSSIPDFRTTMISTILATDMQRHFEYMARLGELKKQVIARGDTLAEWPDKEKEQTRELLMSLLIKAADISNVARPFDVSANWASVLIREFARQGELESELQIPTCLFGGPPKKDDALAAAESQKGFMRLFGIPLFAGLADVLPSISCAVTELETNEKLWKQRIEIEKQRQHVQASDTHLTLSEVTVDELDRLSGKRASEPTVVPVAGSPTPSTPNRAPVMRVEPSPSMHLAHEQKRELTEGISYDESKRSSAPLLGLAGSHISPKGPASRRSSKEIALDAFQQLNCFSPDFMSAGSRRGSADATWQIHHSYPNSRRGSKDESLTTILVTSSSQHRGRQGSNASPKIGTGMSGSRRSSIPHAQIQATNGPSSVPPSRSNATSTATITTTTRQSQSTQPSSLAPDESDGIAGPFSHHRLAYAPEPFAMRHSNSVSSAERDDSRRQSSNSGALSASPVHSTPSAPFVLDTREAGMPNSPTGSNSRSGYGSTSELGGTAGSIRGNIGSQSRKHPEPGLHQSRSRSRLRGLKFWRKRRDVQTPAGETEATATSPSI